MDVVIESHKGQIEVEESGQKPGGPEQSPEPRFPYKLSHQLIKVGIGVVDVRISNKEMQELKDYVDNIMRYHDEIEFELKRELAIIRTKNLAYGPLNSFDRQGLFGAGLNPAHYFGSLAEDRSQDELEASGGVLFKA